MDGQELGREKFVERVWEWKEEKGGYIMNQVRRDGKHARRNILPLLTGMRVRMHRLADAPPRRVG